MIKRTRKFDALKIRLASPDDILRWSHGEVTQAETINYRTHQPEEGGLFCQRIFGPVKDYECACGKYKGKKYENVVCEVCGVKVTSSKVRREWMGHISLNAPVVHIWYYKNTPSRLGQLLGLSGKDVEDIVYLNVNLVTDDGGPFIPAGVVVALDGEERIRTWFNNFKRELEDKKQGIPGNIPKVKQELNEKVVIKGEPRFVAGPDALKGILSLIYEENYPVRLYADLKQVWKARKELRSKLTNFFAEKLQTKPKVIKDIIEGKSWLFFDGDSVQILDEDRYLLLTSAEKRFAYTGLTALAKFLAWEYISGGEGIKEFASIVEKIPNRYGRFRRLTERKIGLPMDKWFPSEIEPQIFSLEDVLLPPAMIVLDNRLEENPRIAETKELYRLFFEDEIGRFEFYVNPAVAEERLSALSKQLEKEEFSSLSQFISSEDRAILDDVPRMQVVDVRVNIQGLDVLTDDVAKNIRIVMGPEFKFGMGAEAFLTVLEKDFDNKQPHLRLWVEYMKDKIRETQNTSQKSRLIKRLGIMEAFLYSESRPAWMILKVLPVIPPELRPILPLEGGKFAASELNDLYRRVINRNNRLKKMMEKKAPDIILKNEKRLLQDAVDALLDNSRKQKPVTDSSNRPLKSLTDTLSGKQGRFRQNLLGKRVDYSGRSVIVIGPELELDECGLPKDMAVELFKPFLINRLLEYKIAETFKEAKEMIERKDERIFDVLEEVVKDHYVLLNRAPTLHRPSIEAFRPVLVDMKAISIPAMVCPPFNADFDGDQMAVHVPLTEAAQAEARLLMASNLNFISPASGKPLAAPSQDIVIGNYYLTMERDGARGEGMVVASVDEAFALYRLGKAELHAKVWYPVISTKEELQQLKKSGAKGNTTIGRIIFNYEIGKRLMQYGLSKYLGKGFDIFKKPEDYEYEGPKLDYVNRTLDKKGLYSLISDMVDVLGVANMKYFLDVIKDIGFHYATVSGLTISLDELRVLPGKDELVENAEEQVAKRWDEFEEGTLTEEQRYAEVVKIWRGVIEESVKRLEKMMETDYHNNLFMMIRSGARGNIDQLRQTVALRGLMVDATGRVLETPIKSSFIEGLSVHEYFISTHGGRKGQVDTALRTADAGYLTRRLVDSVQALVVRESDHEVRTIDVGIYTERELEHQILGRLAAEDVVDPRTGELIVKKGEVIDTDKFAKIRAAASTIKVFTELKWVSLDALLDRSNFLENLYHNRYRLAADVRLPDGTILPAGSLVTPVMVERLKQVFKNDPEPKLLLKRVDGILVRRLVDRHGDEVEDFQTRVMGRFLAEDVVVRLEDGSLHKVASAGDYIDDKLWKEFEKYRVDHVWIKSPITCQTEYGVCVKCYGKDLARHALVEKGEAVGIIAAQSIGEPGTQLTLRTFHTGGAAGAAGDITIQGLPRVESLFETRKRGFVDKVVKPVRDLYDLLDAVRADLKNAYLDLRRQLLEEVARRGLESDVERQLKLYVKQKFDAYYGKLVSVFDEVTEKLQFEYNWNGVGIDIYQMLRDEIQKIDKTISSDFRKALVDDLLDYMADVGKVADAVLTAVAKLAAMYVEYLTLLPGWFLLTGGIKGPDEEKVREVVAAIVGAGRMQMSSQIRDGIYDAILKKLEGEELSVLEALRDVMPYRDGFFGIETVLYPINTKRGAQPLPAHLSAVSGRVMDFMLDISPDDKMIGILVKGEEDNLIRATVVWNERLNRRHIRVKPGDYIIVGDRLTREQIDLNLLLENYGVQPVVDFLIAEIQAVYQDQKVDINDKHFEIVIRQMLSKVLLSDDGDSESMVPGSLVDLHKYEAEVRVLRQKGLKPPKGVRKVLGITRVAKFADSWLSAASFQETPQALTDAAIASKVDRLVGMKENVIVGSLIPAGTGIYEEDQFRIKVKGKEPLEGEQAS